MLAHLQLSALYGALHPSLQLAAAAAKKSSSSSSSIVFILLILALGAYMMFGPQRRRRRMQMSQQSQYSPGDEVVTGSGIVGRVEDVEADRVHLTIAPGTTIEVLRNAIARRIDPPVPPSDEVNEAGEQDRDHPGDEDDPGGSS